MGLCLLGAACGEPAPQDPRQVLTDCGLPEPCPEEAGYDLLRMIVHEPETRCVLAALERSGPVHVAAVSYANGGDVSSSYRLDVYRWADGTATCIEDSYGKDLQVYACDTELRAECRDLAEDAPLPENCQNWGDWGIAPGEDVAAACGPVGDTADPSETSSGSSDTAAEGGEPLGMLCDHEGVAFEAGPHVSVDADCAGGYCVYAEPSEPPELACTGDDACNADAPSHPRYACSDGACVLTEAYKQEHSYCAQSCSNDFDCYDANGPTTPCLAGFVCAIATTTCCQRMCICFDWLDMGQLTDNEAACSMSMTCDL